MANPRSTDGWSIDSHVGIGPVRFGMTQDQVRAAIGGKATPWGDATEEFKLGHHMVEIRYRDDRCELVVVRGGAGPGGPELAGRGFLQRPYGRALEWMRERDPSVLESDDRVCHRGVRSDKLGAAIFCTGSASSTIDEVVVFVPTYFTVLHPDRWSLAGQALPRSDVPAYSVRPSNQVLDAGIEEEWIREISDPQQPLGQQGVHNSDVHPVSATKWRKPVDWRWEVSVAAMEHVRDVPLEAELRRRIASALRDVQAVADVRENDREVWGVRGDARGSELVAAVAGVVDALAPEIRAHLQIGIAWI